MLFFPLFRRIRFKMLLTILVPLLLIGKCDGFCVGNNNKKKKPPFNHDSFQCSFCIRSEQYHCSPHNGGKNEPVKCHQLCRTGVRRRPLPGQPARLLPLYFPLQAPADSLTTHFMLKYVTPGISVNTRLDRF